jgi:hypothetical protein
MRYAGLGGIDGGPPVIRSSARAHLRQAAHLAIVGATLLLGGASTEARPSIRLPEIGTPVEYGQSARPVAAWNDFCARMPGECTVDLSEPTHIGLDSALHGESPGQPAHQAGDRHGALGRHRPLGLSR